LDAIRSDKVFNKLLEIINKTTESVALETLKALALSASSSTYQKFLEFLKI
jgi:lantibiotic modifying enzyme